MLDVHLDRALGNIELARDQLVAQAAGDMLENSQFLFGKARISGVFRP